MESVKEVLNNKKINVKNCPICGKPYEVKTFTVLKNTDKERTITVQIPACDCEQKHREKRAQEISDANKKEILENKFKTALITPYYRRLKMAYLAKNADKYGNEKELKIMNNFLMKFKPHTKGLLLLGNPGTGKTALLAGVANELIKKYNVLFVTLSELVERFASYSFEHSGNISPLLDKLVQFDFIVIDDIGRENYTDRRKEIVFRIFDALMNYEVTTALTANFESIQRLMQIPEWGAVLDRLKEICGVIIRFEGKSKRGQTWQ